MEIALLTTLIVVTAGSFWQQFQNYVKLRDLIERSNKDTRDLIERSNKDTRDLIRADSDRLSDIGERTARIEGLLSERERRDDESGDSRSDAA